MKRITIGRYETGAPITTSPFYDHEFAGTQISGEQAYAGWIEGLTDDDQSWILFIDQQGRPEIFWPNRDDEGGVVGTGIGLQDGRIRKFLEIMAEPDPRDQAMRMKGAAESVLKYLDGDPETVEAVGRIKKLNSGRL